MQWQLQDAKNKFSQLVQKAQQEGPQTVTVRGERAAVILSARDYDALRASQPSLVDDLLDPPAWDDDFSEAVVQRSKLPSRDVAF